MKRILSLFLAICILLTVAGCKKQTAGEEPAETIDPLDRTGKVVGICMPDKVWETTGNNLKTRLESMGYTAIVNNAQGSVATQKNQLKELPGKGVNCVIVTAVDAFALAEDVAALRDAGIPVIAYERLITDTNAITYYLAPDYKTMGKEVGEYIISAMNLADADRQYTFELFMDNPEDNTSVFFYDGVLQVLQTYILDKTLVSRSSRLDFEDVCVADGSFDTAASLCATRLESYDADTPVDICIAGSDQIAKGVISALEAAGYTKNLPMITGVGYTDATLAGGKMQLSAYASTEKITRACASLVDAAIFRTSPRLEGEMTTVFNNTASVATYFCGCQLVDTPTEIPPESTAPESPHDETFTTEDTRPEPSVEE